MKKFVKSVRKHEELILNYFKAKRALSSGIVEGLNRNVNLVTRKAYGFRTFDALETALYHTLGKPPEPKALLNNKCCNLSGFTKTGLHDKNGG